VPILIAEVHGIEAPSFTNFNLMSNLTSLDIPNDQITVLGVISYGKQHIIIVSLKLQMNIFLNIVLIFKKCQKFCLSSAYRIINVNHWLMALFCNC